MTKALADRIRAIRKAPVWTIWEAACYFAGDYWGRYPARLARLEWPLTSKRTRVTDHRVLLGALESRTLLPGQDMRAPRSGALLFTESAVDLKGGTFYCSRFIPPEAPFAEVAFIAAFKPEEYLAALQSAPKPFREGLPPDYRLAALIEHSPLFNDEDLAAIEEWPEEDERKEAEALERDLFENWKRGLPEEASQAGFAARSPEAVAMSPEEKAERKRQKASGQLFSTWPPTPLEPERFPTLKAMAPEHRSSSASPEGMPQATQHTPSAPNAPRACDDEELTPGVTIGALRRVFDKESPRYRPELAAALWLFASFERYPVGDAPEDEQEPNERLTVKESASLRLNQWAEDNSLEFKKSERDRILKIVNWEKAPNKFKKTKTRE